MTENVCSLLDNLTKHNSRDYGYELSKIEIVQILKLFDDVKELEQYRAIGTVRGYERAIETSEENYNLYREYKALLREYEAIGMVEEFKALKEKCVAKKPLKTVVGCYKCPCCGATQMDTFFFDGYSYCHSCGTKIDWQ